MKPYKHHWMYVLVEVRRRGAIYCALLLLMWGAACQPDEEIQQATPTPVETSLATPTATLSTPTVTATVNLTPPSPTFPPTVTPTLIPTEAPPTQTPLPTDTPGPYVHTIRSNDDCISIIRDYGHVDLDVLQLFYQMNEMTLQRCILPPAGDTVLVPRPTTAAGAVPTDVTLTPSPTFFVQGVDPGSFFAVATYCVVEEDTLTSIALKNSTSNQKICQMNPLPEGINCSGCDFSVSSVGSCPNPPLLSVGQCLRVPGSTAVPSSTPPPSGQETITPTPTHRPPNAVYPIPGSSVTGFVRLQWTGVGLLQADEYYVVTLNDQTTGQFFIQATKNSYLDVPSDYVPNDGQAHNMVWFVAVQVRTPDGLFVPAGGRSSDYLFVWG